MASKTEVAEVKENSVAQAGVYDYGEMAREGFEETTINDLSIPFLNVLQTNSPEVEDQTVDGCKAGDILNSVTKEIMKQPLVFQPVYKEEVWVGWVPRNKGGGLAARYEPTDEVVKAAIKKNGGSRIPPKDAEGKRIPFKDPDGNDLVETHYVYGLIMDEEGQSVDSYGVLAFSSAKIKVQKDWMTSMYTIKGQPPMFANRAKISTAKEKREGGSFFNFNIHPFGPTWRESLIVPDEKGMALLKDAKEFREMIMNGLARPDYNGAPDEDQGGGGTSGADKKPVPDSEMPF